MVPPDLVDLMVCSEAMPDPIDPGTADDDDVRPAPPSIGADVPLTYFGPAPSDSNPRLIGPVQLLTAGQLDEDAGTLRLPLYEGRLGTVDGPSVWYVLTDTTDAANAEALGLNHAPKLAYADTDNAVREGRYERHPDGELYLVFDAGTVDFSPTHSVTPGAAPDEFPPQAVTPGSVGDADYSPLVRITNAGGHVYNAPMIAYDVTASELAPHCGGVASGGHSILHDKVVDICPEGAPDSTAGTVNLQLTAGFSFGRPVLYLSTEANKEVPAALERATWTPALDGVRVGADDSAFSAIERIFVTVNGPTNNPAGDVNPQRQGLLSALRGQGGPLNVLGGIPTVATDYSPLWDVNFAEWTSDAMDRGYASRVTEEFQILGLVERGHMTGPGGTVFGSSGVIVNCPIVHRFL